MQWRRQLQFRIGKPDHSGRDGMHPGSTAAATTCTGGLFPHNQTTTGFLSTFPDVNTSNDGVAKIDYHVNEKNTISGDFLVGRYLG